MDNQKELFGKMRYVTMVYEDQNTIMASEEYKLRHPLVWRFLGRERKKSKMMLDSCKDICYGLAFGQPDLILTESIYPLEKLADENFWVRVEIVVSEDPLLSQISLQFNTEVIEIIRGACALAQSNILEPLPRGVIDFFLLRPAFRLPHADDIC